ncbi:hypothetical protein BB560_003142 [Smittium megazygosporum]|uniref:Uncharacterized protein n=1 Tax=Smittium megazygosporum TaxID=133381 RepID=A0A2T9ZCS8_9FUNG|nr:hypothetical protein BB560_003142 [Smittium megazygosporum]
MDDYRRFPVNSESSKPKKLYDPKSDKIVPVNEALGRFPPQGLRAANGKPKERRNGAGKRVTNKFVGPSEILHPVLEPKTQIRTILVPSKIPSLDLKIHFMDKPTTLIDNQSRIYLRKLFSYTGKISKNLVISSFGRKGSGKSTTLSSLSTDCLFRKIPGFNDNQLSPESLNCFISTDFQVFLDYPAALIDFRKLSSLSLAISLFLWSDIILLTVDAQKTLNRSDPPLIKLLTKARQIAKSLAVSSGARKAFFDPQFVVVFNNVQPQTPTDIKQFMKNLSLDSKNPPFITDLQKNNFSVYKYFYMPHKDADPPSLSPYNAPFSDTGLSELQLSKLGRFWLNSAMPNNLKFDSFDFPQFTLNSRSFLLDNSKLLFPPDFSYQQSVNNLTSIIFSSPSPTKPIFKTAGPRSKSKITEISLSEWTDLIAETWDLISLSNKRQIIQ